MFRIRFMKKIVLISCVKKKRDGRHKAEDLYISPFFKKSMAYAKANKPDKIFILSALHGLLPLGKRIDNYDLSLNNFKVNELRTWADRTIHQLGRVSDLEQDIFIFLAGDRYRKYLLPKIIHYKIPMKGLGIGKQLRYLKRNCNAGKL